MENSCKYRTLFQILLLLFTISQAQAYSNSNVSSTYTNFIKSKCNITTYSSICLKALLPYASSVQTNTTKLCDTALDIAIDGARNASAKVSKLAKVKGISNYEAAAIKDCISDLKDAVYELKQTLAAMDHLTGPDKDFQWDPDLSAAEVKDVVGSSNSNWETLIRDHEVYASLLRAMETSKSSRSNCIGYAVSASSTDNYPDESIVNTLVPRNRYLNRPSYWSSKGHRDSDAPETLIYKLKADICVITEVDIQPFEAYFQPGNPIYSAKSVRFRIGFPKSSRDESDLLQVPHQQPADDKFIWTYTSQEFPMRQENCFQQFSLPEPVLCIGGYLQIQLLGRVQRQEMDDLFYICVCQVKVVGRVLSPAFDVEILEPSRGLALRYKREVLQCMLESMSDGGHQDSNMPPTQPEEFQPDAALLEYLLQVYQPGLEMEWEDDDDEMEELGIL